MRLIPVFFLLLLIPVMPAAVAGDVDQRAVTLSLSSEASISISQFGSEGDRILWIPSEYGINKARHYPLLDSLASLKHEVWLLDLHESYFIPPGRSSYTGVPPEDIAETIARSLPEDDRKLFIVATGRGAVLSLLAIRQWQHSTGGDHRFGGIIMLHPNFQADTPQPGTAIEYLPVVDATRLPVFIIQPEKSNKFWYLDDLVTRLTAGGGRVYTQVIKNAGDGYHSRADVSDIEERKAAELPRQIARAAKVLARTGMPENRALPAQLTPWQVSPLPDGLQPYSDDGPAPELQLRDTAGKLHNLQQYRGKVVLLNFWATWCPPCVEEIPSLGRLQQAFAREGLVVLSVDIGETEKEVKTFLTQVHAEFPVLLDVEGSTVRQWKIVAFPTTFVIDRNGRIRLAYYGALQWDNADVIAQLQQLVKQQ